ncbi:MAG: hypothetical protein HIU84_01015 [Acidobacteria bacterium]|nr:hypothetical protein [Acidobacteriota bacterium]
MGNEESTGLGGNGPDPWRRSSTRALCQEDSPDDQVDVVSENELRRSFEIARERLRVMNQSDSGDILLLQRLSAQQSRLTPVYQFAGPVMFAVALLTEFASAFEELDGNFAVAQWLIDDEEGDRNLATDVAQQVLVSISAQLRRPELAAVIGEAGVRQLRLGLTIINAAMNRQCTALFALTSPTMEPGYAIDSVLNAALSVAGMVSCAFPGEEIGIDELLAHTRYPSLDFDIVSAIKDGSREPRRRRV